MTGGKIRKVLHHGHGIKRGQQQTWILEKSETNLNVSSMLLNESICMRDPVTRYCKGCAYCGKGEVHIGRNTFTPRVLIRMHSKQQSLTYDLLPQHLQ